MMNLQSLVALFLGTLLLSSCAQFSGFQTGRTAGRNGGDIYFAVAGLSTEADIEIGSDSTGSVDVNPSVVVPVVEVGGRFGLAERFDIGLRFSTSLSFLVDAKYQIVGDQESVFAMSLGGTIGYQGLGIIGLWQGQVPLFFSVHPNEKVGIYFSPKFISQFGDDLIDASINYGSFSSGIELGQKVKFVLDFSYAKILNDQEVFDVLSFWQIGAGVKIAFSGQ